jgi:hypothetical protein
MKRWFYLGGMVAYFALAGWALRAQDPLVIDGVADQQVAADAIAFRVPAAAGYTYTISLDGQRVPTDVTVNVTNVNYHELLAARVNLDTGATTNRLIRFIIRSSERRNSEWGLSPWVPYPVVNATAGELAGAHLRLLAPKEYPLGLEIPVVAWIENPEGNPVRANAQMRASGYPTIQLRRGAGAGLLPATQPAGALNYAPSLPGVTANPSINLESNTIWTYVGGLLDGAITWPANSRIAVTNHLALTAGGTLTIGEGTIVRLNSGVNLTNDGAWTINGSEARPVVFTPVNRAHPWGGFFMKHSGGSLVANGTIFIASGADPKGGAGHKPQQCLFYIDERPRLALTNCAAIDLAGQFGHVASGMTNASDTAWTEVNIVHTLVQRCVTGGEWTCCKLKLLHSAILEVPYATSQFADDDEDGIYFTSGEYEVRDSVIGWTRDDGIDAGSGYGGSVVVSNTWIEATFHEACAWSGGGGASGTRRTINSHCVAMNCGQGYECGWSAGTAYSPADDVNNCLAIGNGIGARFGDNYNWSYYGFLRVSDSILLNNNRDVWGYNWQADAGGWSYRSAYMDIQNNFLTRPNAYHPNNTLWNPATDGWRLADYTTTPPDAPVGVAFVTWTNQLDLAEIYQGIPVGLSCFTPHFVSVNYAFADPHGVLSSGTLEFAPGETVKRIYPANFSTVDKTFITVTLSQPVQSELTGESQVTFQGSMPAPRISFWSDSASLDRARAAEGVALVLSAPAAESVTVECAWEVSEKVLTNITVTFLPGQTLQWVSAPELSGVDQPLVRLTLSHPTAALLDAKGHFYWVPTRATPTNRILLNKGASWKYNDAITQEVANWYAIDFDDQAWKQGPAPLGYGNSPSETTTVGYGPDSSHKHLATYFRAYFEATNAASLSRVTLHLLRDDAAVVYLNGAEIHRENLPVGAIRFDTPASTNFGGTATAYASTGIPMSSLPTPVREGTNVLAVEIHQNNGGSSDILFDLELTGSPQPVEETQPMLYWGAFNRTNLVLAWSDPAYLLEQAETVAGPYTNAVQTTPLEWSTTGQQQYFRLRK